MKTICLLLCLLAYDQTFQSVKAKLESLPDSSSISFEPGTIRGNELIHVTASNCRIDFSRLKIVSTGEVDNVIRFSGNANMIYGLIVDGGLDHYPRPTTRAKRGVGIADSGTGNVYRNCSAGYCHAGPYAAAWEFTGEDTKLFDCEANEGGLWNYRAPKCSGLLLVKCNSNHLRNRPEMTGTKRRHFGGGATNGSKVTRIAVYGGRWESNYQWCSNVFDIGNGSVDEIDIQGLSIFYRGDTFNSTGNENINVWKFDGVKKVSMSRVNTSHPSVNNVMFTNVASLTDLKVIDSNVDGYFGYSLTPDGGAGGSLFVNRCRIGMRSNNKVVIGGYQTNNFRNMSRLSSVLVANTEFKAAYHPAGPLWANVKGSYLWRFRNVNFELAR